MVEFTHFMPSGKKYANPDSKNGCPSAVKPCERNRGVAESASDDCAWAVGMATPSHPTRAVVRRVAIVSSIRVLGFIYDSGGVRDQFRRGKLNN